MRQILLQGRAFACALLGELGRCLELAEQFLADAAARGEPLARQYAVLAVLDMLVFLGDVQRGRRLLQELDGLGTQELAHYGIKLALGRAFLELQAGDPAAARCALTPLGDGAALEQLQDRAYCALRWSELLLAEGDAAAALARLEPWRGELPNVELVAQVWAQRLRAQLALGRVDAADWSAAHAALDASALPPTDALDLRMALWRSAPPGPQAQALERSIATDVARLAATLEQHPQARAALLARYRRA